MMDMAIELIVTLITFATIMIFTYSVFSLPPMKYHKQIAILALVVGSTNFYFKFAIDSEYFIIAQMTVWAVMMIILRGYSIMYSMIVCIVGAIFITVIETAITLGAIGLKWSSADEMANNLLHFTAIHMVVSAFYLLVSYLLLKYNIGFKFVRIVFSGTYILRGYNFIWAAILIVTVVVLQIFANSYNRNSYNTYFIILMAAILIYCVYSAFVKNKLAVEDREGGDKNKNLG